MKKKFIVLISIITTVLLAGGIFVSAYFAFFYKLKGSEIVMENVKFTVNDNPNKSDENSIYLSNEDISKTDGYQIVLNYSLNGSFVSNYAMHYSTYFQLEEDASGVSKALDLYHFENGFYKFIGKLSDLAPLVSSENEPSSVYSSYLGPMGTHQEKFLVIYPMGSDLESNVSIKILISTKSNIALTDAASFPFYYLNDVGVIDEGSTAGRKAENLLITLTENNEDADIAKGRTIVLMRDIEYSSKTDITFNNLVGIDLNGYTLDLKGGTIKFTDANDVASGFTNNHPNCSFTDSKGTGSINGKVVLDYSSSVVDVEDSFISALSAPSDLTISNASLDVFKSLFIRNLEEVTKIKHLSNAGNYSFDALGYLKNYLTYFTVSLLDYEKLYNETSVAFDSVTKKINVGGVSKSEVVRLTFAVTNGVSNVTIPAVVEIYGTSAYDCVKYLESYIPKKLNGSIYLPKYIEAFNAFITWLSSDEDILTSNGQLLPDGYKELDNWYKHSIDLGFIVDQNGNISSGYIGSLEIEILTEAERANLLFNEAGIVFASENADSNKYSFEFIDILAEKYHAYRDNEDPLKSTEPVDLSIIATEFAVTLDGATYEDKIANLTAAIKTKLGLKAIPYVVTADQEAQYVVETKTDDNITEVIQNGIPASLINLVYNVTFAFDNGGVDNKNVVKTKVITVNASDEVVSFVDLSNTLRVPFDAYTKYMTDFTTKVEGNLTHNVYNPYINSFELVSTFNNTAIEYTVPSQYSDYVKIRRYENGTKVLEISKDNVPADTHTVTIVANIEGFDDPIYLPFTCVGVIHNASSANHAEFEDGKLYIELLNLYDKNSDQVLTDLEAKNSPITNLTIKAKKITSLIGLRYFTNLTTINFEDNEIINISDVSYLESLTSVNLAKNKIPSLEPFRYMDNLKVLNVSNNQLSTLEPIQYLTGLSELHVNGNYIIDFQYIQNLTKLTKLSVYGNRNSSDIPTVYLGNDAQGLGAYTYVIRGNQYYFNLLANNSTANVNVFTNNGTADTISNNSKTEALYLSSINPIYKTSDTVSLPTYFVAPNGTTYPITYNVTSEYENYISISKVTSGSDLGKITNITLTQLPIDKEIVIYANIIGLAEDSELFYRPITLKIRKGNSDSRLFGAIEVKPNYWVMGTDLVKDDNLLGSIWGLYDNNNDGKITNTELLHTSSEVTLNLEDKNIKSLSGIQYFGNITEVNLRNNTLELNDESSGRDITAGNISYLAYLSNLKVLYLNGQYYDFDDLLNYTRLKEGSNYQDTRSESLTVEKAILIDSSHLETDETNLFDKSITVDFPNVGLTTLTKLNTNGCQKLSEYEVKTKLYHVFLVNTNVKINKDTAGTDWNPAAEELTKILGNMTQSATFINYNDKIEIKKSYSFYLYDDLYPTAFTLSYDNIDDKQYVYAAYTDEYYGPTTNNAYKNIYNYGNTELYTLVPIDTSFSNKDNHKLNTYFSISSDSTNISIQYKRLMYRDYQAYLSMKLSASYLSDGRRSYSAIANYNMALFMQYNTMYTVEDDENIDPSVNGKPFNEVFGSTELLMFAMDSLSDSLYGGRRGHYFKVIKNDGTVENYYFYKDGNKTVAEGDADYGKKESDYYVLKSSNLATYSGKYNNKGAFDMNGNRYFFIAGNYMPTAKSAADGLRFFPQIKKVYFKNDAVLGDGKDLINIEELFICYSYFDIKDFNTVLPNLKVLTISQSTSTNLSNEKGTDSNPNNLIETYMVYMPNLIQFHFSGEGLEEKGQMYEWSAFLAYSYIPYSQVHDSRYQNLKNGSDVGGIKLETEKYLYWYDESINADNADPEHPYNNFKKLYYKNNSVYTEGLKEGMLSESDLLSITNGEYDNIFTDSEGHHLSAKNQLFRKVEAGTVKLNNFKLSRGSSAYDTGINKYSSTYEHQLIMMEIYRNLPENTITHYYIGTDSHVDNGDSRDFDPKFTPITFATTLEDEYNEIAPTIGDLHVNVYGTTFDGRDLSETGIDNDYSKISWTDTDYSDYFRQGLIVLLPLTFDDFKTGNVDYDKNYRTFTITWYASYVAYASSSYRQQYSQLRIGYSTFDGTNVTCFTENLSSTVFTKIEQYSPDYVYNDRYVGFQLNNPGYYLFEGVLELSDGTNSYTYNTTYDARQAQDAGKDQSYTYTNDITGSVSIIYPITITSLSGNIFNASGITSRIDSITKIGNLYKSTNTLRWFDTIVDRSFKYVVFSNFAKTEISQTASSYDINIGTNNLNPFDADNNSRIRLLDKILYSFYGLESYGDNIFTSSDIAEGIDSNAISAYAPKTYAGLKRFLSDIYTLDGWHTLKVQNFYYKYASTLTYLPVNFPTTLQKFYISSTYGINYYGGLFNSNVTDARLTYYSTNTPDVGVDVATYAKMSYQNDNIFDIYDYPDLIKKINGNSSFNLKQTTLSLNSISEESYPLLADLSNKVNNKVTIYLSPGYTGGYLYTFTNYNDIKYFCDNVNESKLDIRINSTYSNNAFSGGDSLITILKSLVSDYDKVSGTNALTKDKLYEKTGNFSSNKVSVIVPNSLRITDHKIDNPDFYPDLNIGAGIKYNVAIRYSDGEKKVQILKELTSTQDSVDVNKIYTYKIATFKSGVKVGTVTSYTADDLNFYDPSEFDENFVKFLIHLTKDDLKTDYSASKKINNQNEIVVMGPQTFKHYNYKTNEYETYIPKEDNSPDPLYIEGMTYILDKHIKISEKNYVIIVNTEFYNFDYWGDGNVIAMHTESYATLDVKGFELLPFKAIVQGNAVSSEKWDKYSPVYITKIINSSNTLGATPKLQYIEINNKPYERVIGSNVDANESYVSMFTTIVNFDNLAKSLADGATLVFGDRCKVLQRFLKYDETNGVTLINDQSKTIYVNLVYSKMHLLFNNYASTYNGSSFSFDTAYDISFNYQRLKEEILNATIGEETVFFNDYHDFYTPMYYKLVNFAGGELTNITLYNNLSNHPFYSEKRGVLANDSCYNYYISYKDTNNSARIIYSGTAYDVNKLFGTIMNVHSNNIRKLSNNKNISMYFESNGVEELNDNYVYTITDSVSLKLPKSIEGTNVIYLPVATYFATAEYKNYTGSPFKFFKNEAGPIIKSSLYFDQNYGFTYPKNNFNSTFDIFTIKEYATYFEIALKDSHSSYTAMRYMFAAFEYNGEQNTSDEPLVYNTMVEWFQKTKYFTPNTYDYAFNVDKGETYTIKRFYIDINTNPAIGRQTIKDDDPLYLPMSSVILGNKYNLTYTIPSEYQDDLILEEVEIEIDSLLHITKKYYKLKLSDTAKNAKDVKISVRIDGLNYTYKYDDALGTTYQTSFVQGRKYVALIAGSDQMYGVSDGSGNWAPISTQSDFNYYYSRGYSMVQYFENIKLIDEEIPFVYSSFDFFVDLAKTNLPAINEDYTMLTNDFYAEVLVDSNGDVVPGSLVSECLDGSTPKAGYKYEIRKADTIFESGVLLTDIYYNGGISLGSSDYTRHDSVSSSNVNYFPKYVVVDINEQNVVGNDYRNIFVKEDNQIKSFERNTVVFNEVDGLTIGVSNVRGYYKYEDNTYTLIVDSTARAESGVTYYRRDVAAETYAKQNDNYRLALLFTKEQIANIHYFSSTTIDFSGNVQFTGESTLAGIEIFPLTNIRIGFINPENGNYSGVNSRGFAGNLFKPLKDMKLVEFELVFKYTTIYINDWTFLFNSRETLTTFAYGGIHIGQKETYGTTHDDFSFLLSFDNLESIRIYGYKGIEETQSFKYLASTLYLKNGKNILTFYQNNNSATGTNPNADIVKNTSADLAVAIPILYKYHSKESIADGNSFIDSDFNYQNNYELYIGDGDSYFSDVKNYNNTDSTTQYLLPSVLNDSGTYYKLTYESLSKFMTVVAVNVNANDENYNHEYSMIQYQELYSNYVFDCLENETEIDDYEFTKNYRIYARFNNLANCLTNRVMISAKIECNSKTMSKTNILDIDGSSATAKTNYVNGNGYSSVYFDGNTYIYTPYTYERILSIYIDHENIMYQ